MHSREEKLEAFGRFLDVLDTLREKCPWDRKQTNESLRPNTIEETFELCDALMKDDKKNICKELGDVLLHVCFYAKIASETGDFDIADVCDKLTDKLIFRHPHVYGEAQADTAGQVSQNWEQIKLKEKDGNKSVLGGVPEALPSLIKAYRIQDKARNVGFDWEKKEDVWDKVREELGELQAELAREDKEKSTDEFGDFLFNSAVFLIIRDNFLGFLAVFLTENVNKLLCFAGLKREVALQSAAGVSAVVKAVFQSFFDTDGVCVTSVRADKHLAVAAVGRNFRARKSEESLDMRIFKLVLLLKQVFSLEIGVSDEESILKINLVLLVVVLVDELAESRNGEISRLVVVVRDFARPDLVVGVLRDIICRFRGDFLIFRRNHGISRSVAAFALILGKRLADGRPRTAPEVVLVVVLDVDIASGLVAVYAVEAIAKYSSLCAALYE